MKITIVQGAFLPVPPLLGGAIEKAWWGLAQEFVRQGHQVTYISRRYGDLPHEEMREGVQHIRIRGFDAPKSLLVLKLWDLIYSWRVLSVLPPADWVVTHTFWLPLLLRDPSRGSVYVHVGRFPKGQLRFYRRAARLQTVSQAIAQAMIAQDPGSQQRVRVIPYPLPSDLGSPEPPETPRHPWILYVGRIHPEKGIGLLIDGFRLFKQQNNPNWRLVIVGPWEVQAGGAGSEYVEQLRARCEPIAEWVDWVGAVFDPTRLYGYHRQSALFVYPSVAEQGETFGLAPLEAMAHACPVLVSQLECFQDFIAEGKTGFAFDHRATDPARALADKLQAILADPEALNRVALAGFAQAQTYRLDRIAQEYLADFASILSPKKP